MQKLSTTKIREIISRAWFAWKNGPCFYKGDSENQTLLFEQRTITIGKKQYLFGKVHSNKTTCKNVEVIDNEKKFNSSLSFRQIRGFKHHKNDGKIGFKFFGLTTKNMTKNNSVIII